MKINKLAIILLIIIILLVGYIIYDKIDLSKNIDTNIELKIQETIHLDYLDIYLMNDGITYLVPLNKEEVVKLNIDEKLKNNLITLYDRSFYYDIYIDNEQLRGYMLKLNYKVIKLEKIIKDNNIYVIFYQENNKKGIFNYQDYLENLNKKVVDDYLNL